MNQRIYNFSAGPATLPLPVLEKVQKELLNYQGTGFSILEASHRSSQVKDIFTTCANRLLKILQLEKNYKVLFLHGGASTAFFQIPMNLLKKEEVADYIETGAWVQKAIKEAKRFGQIHMAATSIAKNFSYIPRENELKFSPNPKYIYLCSNNTIFGTQYKQFPNSNNTPLIGDFSSDILCRPMNLNKFGLIFAGSQKNLGPAGTTVLIIRQDILEQCNEDLPSMCSYKIHQKNESLYNTPTVFAVYFINHVLEWIEEMGGVEKMGKLNEKKANLIYNEIDNDDFYTGTAEKKDRSIMNLTFTLPTDELSHEFILEAKKRRLDGLKGHRSVGGIRASMYNAFPLEGAQRLADFMRQFAQKNG